MRTTTWPSGTHRQPNDVQTPIGANARETIWAAIREGWSPVERRASDSRDRIVVSLRAHQADVPAMYPGAEILLEGDDRRAVARVVQ
jgi:hypothetical protein